MSSTLIVIGGTFCISIIAIFIITRLLLYPLSVPAAVSESKSTFIAETPPPAKEQHLPQSILKCDVERFDWVQRLTTHIFNDRHGMRYNVLTINTEIDYHFAPVGVIETISTTYVDKEKVKRIHYKTTVFENGNLVRLGDGGIPNWFFIGSFKRDDNVVQFTAL